MEKARHLLRPDGSVAFPPPDASIWDEFPLGKRFRRKLMAPLFRLADTGLPGLTPLQTHVVICGYHRSGTTLLQAMFETAYPPPYARTFPDETSAWRAATYAWRNSPLLVSKMPQDVTRLTAIRNFYKTRKAELRVILTTRDPRDVLTSIHDDGKNQSGGYAHDLGDFRVYHAFFRHHKNDPHTLHLPYERLVSDVDAVQAEVEAFIGHKAQAPFRDFHKRLSKGFETRTLNGVRPVEKSLVGRWAQPKHAARIEEVLREIPEFTAILIELGYEQDASWIDRWRASVS